MAAHTNVARVQDPAVPQAITVQATTTQETSTTAGTGALTLAGAVAGYSTFASTYADGDTVAYQVTDTVGNFEVGIGRFDLASNTVSRDTVYASSNLGALVNFPAGTRQVFVSQLSVAQNRSALGLVLALYGGALQ